MNKNLKMLLIGLLLGILVCKMPNVVFGFIGFVIQISIYCLIGYLAHTFYKTYKKEKNNA